MSQLLQYYKSFQSTKPNATAAPPTFQDLTIDDNLTDLQRVVRYSKSNIALQRLVHVKLLSDIVKSVGYYLAKDSIVPLFESLAADSEPSVKQHFLEQMQIIAKVFFDCKIADAYNDIVETMLPIASQCLEDPKTEVRQSAVSCVVTLANFVYEEDLGPHILTIILRLAHDDDHEEMRMVASELLNSLAERLGVDLCKQFVIPEIVSLAEDPVFRVRKAVALSFSNICKVGGEHELFERLMPAFVRLSKDDMYRVRKAIGESLYDVSKNVSDDIRVGVLIEIFLRLAQDPSRLVKQTVLKQSGMFISTLPVRYTTENILHHYCSMAKSPTGDMQTDTTLKEECAYCFPGVLQTIGGSRWSELKEVYHIMLQSKNSVVKQNLALSLHEVARILHEGGVGVDVELSSVFEDMIQDAEAVQMGVIKNIAKFFALLPPPCRLSYLPLLHDLLHSASPFNWRIRQSLAGQLPELLLLPKRENVCETLFPLIMALFQDPVASVRHATFKGIAELINMLHTMATSPANEIGGSVPSTDSDEMNLSSSEYAQQCLLYVIDNLNIFMKDAIYMKRLFWVELVQTLLKTIPRDVCEQHFVPGIVLLTSDPVCNIRVSISVLLTNWAPEFNPPWMETESTTENPFAWLLARKDIRLCVERLRVDDKDVYRNVSKLQPIFPELEFGFCSCRGLKAAPGGSVPVQVLSLDICEDGAIADEVASRDSLLSVEASTESAAAVVAQTPTAKSSSKPRSHSVDLTQSGHRLFRTATEHFVLGSPIDASSATAYLNLSNKPKEEGLEDRPFWASVDEVAVGEDTVHIPVEAEPVILGTRMTKNFPFDDDEDDLANPQNVLPARENAAVLPDSTDEPVETPETASTIKVDE